MRKVSAVISDVILALSGLLLGIMAAAQLIVLSHMPMDETEHMVLRINGPILWCFLVLVFLALRVIRPLLERLDARVIFLIFTAVYAVSAAYIISHVPATLKDDPYMIRYHAEKFFRGDYIGLTDGYYMAFFPYQLPMLAYETLMMRISDSIRLLFAMNVLFVLLTDLFLWRIAALLFRTGAGDGEVGRGCTAEKYTIVLSFAFLPMLFMILFVYGFIPGLCCFTGAVYFLLRLLKEGQVHRARRCADAVLCVLLFGAAWLLKPNYIIAVTAACIVLVLLVMEHRRPLLLLLIPCLIVLPLLAREAVYQHYRNVSGISFRSGAPFILNVAMGLMPEEEGSGRPGGWYNGYNYNTYEELNYSEELASEAGWDKLRELAGYWGAHPGRAASFFGEKFLTTWCDPLYESVWIGPHAKSGETVKGPIMDSLYGGDYAYLFAEKLMNALVVLILALAAGGLVSDRLRHGKRPDPVGLLFLLFLLGGFVWHLVSETNSQYVYMYIYCLIPYAAKSLAGHIAGEELAGLAKPYTLDGEVAAEGALMGVTETSVSEKPA